MADSFTPTLNLTKPEINQSINTWGNKLNGDMDLIDHFATEKNAAIATLVARIEALEARRIQHGMIMQWAGSVDAIPAGWQLCNGTNGTPDLRDKFVVAAGAARPHWSVGGADSRTVGTSAAGQHAHGGNTAPTTLAEAQMPSHQHGGSTGGAGSHAHSMTQFTRRGDNAPAPAGSGWGGDNLVSGPDTLITDGAGDHAHSFATDFRGGNQAHWHGIYADGNHAHTVSVTTVPAYYAIAFIMKVG